MQSTEISQAKGDGEPRSGANDEIEPMWPYREKLKAYPFMSKPSMVMHYVIQDLKDGKPCDARKYSPKAFATLLQDGFVNEQGEPSEGFQKEVAAYTKFREGLKV